MKHKEIILQIPVGGLPSIPKHREGLTKQGEAEHFVTTFKVFRNRWKSSLLVFELTSQMHQFILRENRAKNRCVFNRNTID